MTIEASQRRYDLNGVRLLVEGNQQWIDFLDPIVATLSTTQPTRPDWTIRLGEVSQIESPPPASRIIWKGALPENLESVCTEIDGRRTLFVPTCFKMTMDIGSQSSFIEFMSEGAGWIGGTGAFWLLGEILAAKQRFLLHGACMIEPQSQAAVAMFAPSGTGKTTTALAFAHNGLTLAGDDALVLEFSHGIPYLWSIPRGLKVDQRTTALLPWLGPVLKGWDSEEQLIALDDLKSLIGIASPRLRRCDVVIVLIEPNATAHRIKSIPKADAVAYILSDNLRKDAAGVDAYGRATFAAVGRLLASATTVSLSVGPDPDFAASEIDFRCD